MEEIRCPSCGSIANINQFNCYVCEGCKSMFTVTEEDSKLKAKLE